MTAITLKNNQTYATEKSKVHTLTVEFILDQVAGPWAKPEDLMRWIATNSYVKQVTFEQPDPVGSFEDHVQLIMAQDNCSENDAKFRAWLGGPEGYAQRAER